MPGGSKKGGGLEVKSAYKAQGYIDPDVMVARGKGTAPFQLKSGNKSSFKMMGSSPMKQLIGAGEGEFQVPVEEKEGVDPWVEKALHAAKTKKAAKVKKVATKKPKKVVTKKTKTVAIGDDVTAKTIKKPKGPKVTKVEKPWLQ